MKYELNKFTAYQGRACQFAVIMIDQEGNTLPVTGATSIKAMVQNTDGTYTDKEIFSSVSWGFGDTVTLYYFSFTAIETALWKLGENRTIFVKLTYSSTVIIREFAGFITVLEELP